MADGQSQIRAQQQKEGVSGHKKGSINQPSDIYALILPVRGGVVFTGLRKLWPAKKIPGTVKLSSSAQLPTVQLQDISKPIMYICMQHMIKLLFKANI